MRVPPTVTKPTQAEFRYQRYFKQAVFSSYKKEPVMSDDLFEIPVPTAPPAQTKTVPDDEFPTPVGVSMGFVGLGQCGGRLAAAFYGLGYRKVVAINTTATDLAKISIPEENKLDLAVGGAGKDLNAAANAISTREEDVYGLLQHRFGDNAPEMTFLCFGMGGGTGAGVAPTVKRVVEQYSKNFAAGKQPRIGAIVALPKTDEGVQPAQNAIKTAEWLTTSGLSPILVLDNDRVIQLYKPSVFNEHKVGNSALAGLLHTLNKLSAEASEHTTFDKADLLNVLGGGVTVLGSQSIVDWSSGVVVSEAIKKSIETSLLADVALKDAKVAGLVFICGPDAVETLAADTLDQAYTMLGRKITAGSTVFRGVYTGSRPGIIAVYALGGAPWPAARLDAALKN